MYRMSVCVLLSGAIALAQQSGKQFKPGEFEAYSSVTKDLSANRFPEAVSAIEDWKQKYPESDYKNEREALVVQAYAGVNQPTKALDAAAPLIAGDLKTTFPASEGQAVILRLLYSAAWAISRIPNPTPEELK